MAESPIINVLTYQLHYKLARQIYNEFQDRLKECRYLIGESRKFEALRENSQTVELLLALSIFHKRVIANFESAVSFHDTVKRFGETETIRIGQFELTLKEKNRLLGILMNYQQLIDDFSIPQWILHYGETYEFLENLVLLKEYPDTITEKEDTNRDELPF
jgi:hypothetical protein